MNEDITARFLSQLANLHTPTDYAQCFPYQSLLTESPIQVFHGFYGIGNQE